MIKEAIEYLLEMARPTVVDVNGRSFSTVQLRAISENSNVETIQINTLSGLVEYVLSNVDALNGKVMIHVESPTEVHVYDTLDYTNDRREYLKAKALLPEITFERFMPRENFQIMMQANFVDSTLEQTNDKEMVLDIISKIVEQQGAEIEDNGMAQSATIKTGIATVGRTELPRRITLKPFRTFAEISQPPSEFILRLREGAQVALFEADGGAWELNAIHSIKEHLRTALQSKIEDGEVVIIG